MTEPDEKTNETEGSNPPESAESADDGAATADSAASEPPVKSKLELVTEERDKLKDQLLRTMADFDNFRKRARRDTEDALRRGKEDTVRDVLPIIDNLERAIESSRDATDVAAVLSGVEMVLKSFEDVAGRMGVTRVNAVGQRFDPNMHDAIQQVESAEHPPGTVVAEAMAGYRIGERLLRPAMVMVAKAPPADPEPAEGES